jgi:hypothetical protein
MRLLFVGPGLCLQLPLDSASRRTPLLFGYRFPPSGSEEDLHLQVNVQPPQLKHMALSRHAPCLAHKKKKPAFSASLHPSAHPDGSEIGLPGIEQLI